MNKSRALSFDTVADTYCRIRPGYPAEIYELIDKHCQIDAESLVMDIGSGHGIATTEIADKWNCQIDAVEPGAQLCDYAKKRYRSYKNIAWHNSLFEDFAAEQPYDALFCATAFHWLDPATRFERCHKLLKPEGLLVLFWNNYSLPEGEIFDKIQEVYRRHNQSSASAEGIRQQQRSKIDTRREDVKKSGCFALIDQLETVRQFTYSADDYISLLKSFSNNSVQEEDQLVEFYSGIREVIESAGGTITIPVISDLVIGRASN